MRVLILGGGGMLGHRLWLACQKRFDTFVAVHRPFSAFETFGLFDRSRTVDRLDVLDLVELEKTLAQVRPQVVVNAVGLIKQRKEDDAVGAIQINALFPHQLARLCASSGSRLIHLSTDCVFSGRKGGYTEEDLPDPPDVYGRSKLLGEVTTGASLTLRTSMIGRELHTSYGLLEWFLAQRGQTIKGFRRAIFSGFTTIALARILADIIEKGAPASGLFHLSAAPISKFDLLGQLNELYGTHVRIEPDDQLHCDRSLDSTRLRTLIGLQPPSWPEMLAELHADPTPYDTWRH